VTHQRATCREASLTLTCVTLVLTLAVVESAQAGGRIVGTIQKTLKGDAGTPLANGSVEFFDSMNAEIVASTTTTEYGSFESGVLPAGSYKIRVSAAPLTSKACVREFAGESDLHADAFSTGVDFGVSDGGDTVVVVGVEDRDASFCEPMLCVPPPPESLSGTVVDAETREPLAGINVRMKDAVNATPRGDLTTDENGFFLRKGGGVCGTPPLKVRLVDPAGVYVSEYVGASGLDSFDLGAEVVLTDLPELSEDLAKMTSAQQIARLANALVDMGLPEAVVAHLEPVLERAQALLNDQNPNNDRGACGILTSFVARLEAMVARGEITRSEADSLSELVEGIRRDLHCHP
jgi:hypothetical protein